MRQRDRHTNTHRSTHPVTENPGENISLDRWRTDKHTHLQPHLEAKITLTFPINLYG